MEENTGLFLMGLGVLLVVAEIFVPGFIVFPIGLGAIGAGVLSYFSMPLPWTLFCWSAISILSWLFMRRLFLAVNDSEFKSGSDALVGVHAKVVKEILANDDSGRVKVYGDEWTVLNDSEMAYRVGDTVEIAEVIGNKVRIKS